MKLHSLAALLLLTGCGAGGTSPQNPPAAPTPPQQVAPPPPPSSSSSGTTVSSGSSSGSSPTQPSSAGSSSSSSGADPATVAGLWSAPGAQLLVADSGAYYAHQLTAEGCDYLWSGQLNLASDDSIAGSAYFWVPGNCASPPHTYALEGALVPGQSITYTIPQGAFDWSYEAQDSHAPPIGALEGSSWRTPAGYTLSIDQGGALLAMLSLDGCALAGQLQGALSDAYPLTLSLSGCDQAVPQDLAPYLTVSDGLSQASIEGLLSYDASAATLTLWLTVQYGPGVTQQYAGGPGATALAYLPAIAD